ncbi:MAG: hypothetical protein ABGX07_14770 [Pirellulaceae bacterium]|nr:hypothetical protein [Planctomycetaceae bacterium]HIK90574.1 hypothetical protein [Planctomycetota bacterium]
MARQTSDREDLLRDATGLVERIELQVPESKESIVAGYRKNGALSVYFGEETVYQFNTDFELRRVFQSHHPIKAEAGELVVLRRVREKEQTTLHRRVLSDKEQNTLLAEACQRLGRLAERLQLGDYHCTGKVPPDVAIEDRLQADLEHLVAQPIRIAAVPNVGHFRRK